MGNTDQKKRSFRTRFDLDFGNWKQPHLLAFRHEQQCCEGFLLHDWVLSLKLAKDVSTKLFSPPFFLTRFSSSSTSWEQCWNESFFFRTVFRANEFLTTIKVLLKELKKTFKVLWTVVSVFWCVLKPLAQWTFRCSYVTMTLCDVLEKHFVFEVIQLNRTLQTLRTMKDLFLSEDEFSTPNRTFQPQCGFTTRFHLLEMEKNICSSSGVFHGGTLRLFKNHTNDDEDTESRLLKTIYHSKKFCSRGKHMKSTSKTRNRQCLRKVVHIFLLENLKQKTKKHLIK